MQLYVRGRSEVFRICWESGRIKCCSWCWFGIGASGASLNCATVDESASGPLETVYQSLNPRRGISKMCNLLPSQKQNPENKFKQLALELEISESIKLGDNVSLLIVLPLPQLPQVSSNTLLTIMLVWFPVGPPACRCRSANPNKQTYTCIYIYTYVYMYVHIDVFQYISYDLPLGMSGGREHE